LKRRPAVHFIVALSAVLTSASAVAYKINPFKDRYTGGEVTRRAGSADSVHEDITHAAIACAADHGELTPIGPVPLCRHRSSHVSARAAGEPGNISNAVIVGTWWNDDPQGFLYRNDVVHGVLAWLAAKSAANRVRNGQLQHRDRAPGRLLYRSHFHDLQFLHAMAARDGESAQQTRQQIIDWIAFTYQVATGEIGEGAPLGTLESPVPDLFTPADPRRTVSYLFKRSRMQELATRELALGSLLHVVQDSFAASHAFRTFDASEACPDGRITQFYAYQGQREKAHGAQDTRRALNESLETKFTHLQNPVEASTRMILFVRRKAQWAQEVLPYLQQTLFCLDEAAEPSGPGEFRRLSSVRPAQRTP
jgi:hypothetical protein